MGSCVHSPGRGARGRSVFTGVVLGLLLTGCAVGDADAGTASPVPRADLAADAEVAASNPESGGSEAAEKASAGKASARGDRAGAASSGKPGERGDAPRRSGTSQAPATGVQEGSWTGLADLDDPAGDHGDGPGYADLAAVAFAERESALRVTVSLGETVPGTLQDREVEGVGIDLYRSSDDESDYQVFLDGGSDGWRAYLQTPDGFVDFPGTFTVRGRILEVQVPWAALGGRREATSSVFVDWSEGTGRLATDGTTRVELRPA